MEMCLLTTIFLFIMLPVARFLIIFVSQSTSIHAYKTLKWNFMMIFFPKLLIIFKRQLIIFPTSFCSEAKYAITKIFPVPRFCHHFSPSTFSAFYTGISGILIAYCVRLISLTENSTQKTIS